MKKLLNICAVLFLLAGCNPNPEEGERSSGSVDIPGNNESPQAGQPTSDTTADNTSGNGSQMTPSDNTQENQGSKTSGAAGQ